VRLGYTQSAVSQQLRALERIVGVTLVTRSPGTRSVELTEAGRQLLGHADAIAGHLATARSDSRRSPTAVSASSGSGPCRAPRPR
jgi:DNA-binding transcriptional LysR family regulator